MSLQTAFRSAQSSLASNALQTATLSRNVSSADTKGYARRIALVETTFVGSPSVTRVARATDTALQAATLDAKATSTGQDVVAKALDALHAIIGDPADERSPSAAIAALKASLVAAAASPQDATGLASIVHQAETATARLRDATEIVQGVRKQADKDMSASVAEVNSLLKQFETANAGIVGGQSNGLDTSDLLDRRDAILDDLSRFVSISTIEGPNGDLAIYTDTGIALFQGAPRIVAMQATTDYAPGMAGQAVYIDGVAVTGSTATMRLGGGALSGQALVRDKIAVDYQAQLDAIAAGLISSFSEHSVSGTSADRTGLLSWLGSPVLPGAGAVGVAASIRVDASASGNPSLIRDGGIGGVDFRSNVSGSTSYSTRLYALSDALEAAQDFGAPGLPARTSVASLAVQSEAWLDSARQAASDKAADASAFLSQSTAALSNAVGVNIDDQMSRMLDLENSYQASAKMMATIDSMYAALFNAVQSLAR